LIPRLTPIVLAVLMASTASLASEPERVGTSPFGSQDEIGMLNKVTPDSVFKVLRRISSGKTYDLSVEFYVGMPSYYFLGQPRFQIWNVHTPQGTIVDDPNGLGKEKNSHVTYSGSAFSMYAHTGTHIDALSHFGLHGQIYNGFKTDDHLGDRGWRKGGIEKFPPIIARGVLLDVARYKGLEVLPESYGITVEDIQGTLRTQNVALEDGDVVMVRTGRMRWFKDNDKYMHNTPGLTRESANFLADRGAIVIGVDNISTDVWPAQESKNWIPVHSAMLSQRGVPIMQNMNLEGLAADRVYQFAWFGAPLKLRGSDGAPLRPVAIPIR
jgi:kynurenine formamidase